ncbi:hypothetical protein EDD27_7694 [Nonomuraea polychroma]|uniref:Uncharacterized protein n=1 Tax=Nonomuraea polychroma TaxID=46176 RepID=A0A438MGP2_9ACTN|nr:hypothetical protein [Nonomuraea polychroma]RVX44927.1 hypothetical protein EDD27_7694 [Nonomuraea polychroma]
MVPEFDVGCYVDYDAERLPEVTAQDVATFCAHGFNREYTPLFDVTWEDAEYTLEIERTALDRAGQADDGEGFEAALEAFTDEAWENEDDGYFVYIQGLDLGVAGLVMAIIAAGATTYTSCRGRVPGSRHHHPHPHVGVVLDRNRASLFAELVLAAGCCLYTSEYGDLAIGAPSVDHCHQLAKMIVERKAAFEELPAPTWREGLEEFLPD